MTTSFTPADIFAALALVVSIYAVWTTSKFNERQQSLIESQKRLNAMLLEKETNKAQNDKKADLGASFIKFGTDSYRLRIINKGKAHARNVSIKFPEGDNVVDQFDVKNNFPLELLDQSQSVDLTVLADTQEKKNTLCASPGQTTLMRTM